MCTLTWRDQDESRVIFFNRDELKTRSRAQPPREMVAPSGLRFLAPIDPDAGGTWMAANEAGLVICLLNRWHDDTVPLAGPFESRGQIVLKLAGCRDLASALGHLPELTPNTRPFDLILANRGSQEGRSWDGKKLHSLTPSLPLTSSSYQFHAVQKARREEFARKKGDLESYHLSPHAAPDAFTVRMNRPDAQTWSRSRLTLSPQRIQWDYWEEFPDLLTPPTLHQATLDLS